MSYCLWLETSTSLPQPPFVPLLAIHFSATTVSPVVGLLPLKFVPMPSVTKDVEKVKPQSFQVYFLMWYLQLMKVSVVSFQGSYRE